MSKLFALPILLAIVCRGPVFAEAPAKARSTHACASEVSIQANVWRHDTATRLTAEIDRALNQGNGFTLTYPDVDHPELMDEAFFREFEFAMCGRALRIAQCTGCSTLADFNVNLWEEIERRHSLLPPGYTVDWLLSSEIPEYRKTETMTAILKTAGITLVVHQPSSLFQIPIGDRQRLFRIFAGQHVILLTPTDQEFKRVQNGFASSAVKPFSLRLLSAKTTSDFDLPERTELPDTGYNLTYEVSARRALEDLALSSPPIFKSVLKALRKLTEDPYHPTLNSKKVASPSIVKPYGYQTLFRSVGFNGPGGFRILWAHAGGGGRNLRIVDVVDHKMFD